MLRCAGSGRATKASTSAALTATMRFLYRISPAQRSMN
jgi:hypothetical protein